MTYHITNLCYHTSNPLNDLLSHLLRNKEILLRYNRVLLQAFSVLSYDDIAAGAVVFDLLEAVHAEGGEEAGPEAGEAEDGGEGPGHEAGAAAGARGDHLLAVGTGQRGGPRPQLRHRDLHHLHHSLHARPAPALGEGSSLAVNSLLV